MIFTAAAHLAAGPAGAKNDYAAPSATQTIPDYVLGPGDKIRVITFGEESLTGTFLVGATGSRVASLDRRGRGRGAHDRPGGRRNVAMLADGFLKDPRVSIEVVDFRPYYILGEVNKPGLYPYTDGLTVDGAVATAGGFTYRANTHKVFIRPVQGNAERKLPLTSGALVHPGDTVRIAERYF